MTTNLWANLAKEAAEKTFPVVKALCFLHVTTTYLCAPVITLGPSMVPTLSITPTLILVDKLSVRLGKVGPSDIVTLRSPRRPRMRLAKRVIGMEGDSVTYVVDPKNSDRCKTVVVPKGHVWIEGDNKYASRDSRTFGAVPYGLIEGKMLCKVWTAKEFGSLAEEKSD